MKVEVPRVSPAEQTVLQLQARHPCAQRSVAEYGLVALIGWDVEGLLTDMLRITCRKPLFRRPLTQVSILETRAFFAFWANHLLWQAKQHRDVRGSLIELLGVGAAMEYHGHWPRSDEFNVIAGLFELRAHEYASGIGAQESSDWLVGLVDLFLEHMAESESGVLPMQTTSERVIMLFNFTVGMELKLLILPRMDHMTRVLSRLALYTPDVRNLTKPAFDQLLESACHEARAARTSHSPWTQ